MTRSQKRRVQCLGIRNKLELEAEATKIWHLKRKEDKPRASANINMVFILPTEYACQEGEDDEETTTDLILHSQPTVFQKLEKQKHRHLKPLHVKLRALSMARQ